MPRRVPPDQLFGEILREARIEKGLSQEQLALACDRHRTYISLLERGQNSPSLRTLFLIASALGLKASELVRRVEQHR
jgi:transcriptional regulator with XRE-family HTH domain